MYECTNVWMYECTTAFYDNKLNEALHSCNSKHVLKLSLKKHGTQKVEQRKKQFRTNRSCAWVISKPSIIHIEA
jgi:tRNA(Phe) wybutosine-synthesizing methylase Tyw3